jgi:hypothetical protein
MPSVMVRMSSVSSSIMRTVSRISWSVKGMLSCGAAHPASRSPAGHLARARSFQPFVRSGKDAAGLSSLRARPATSRSHSSAQGGALGASGDRWRALDSAEIRGSNLAG